MIERFSRGILWKTKVSFPLGEMVYVSPSPSLQKHNACSLFSDIDENFQNLA
jgi:hypothetical protein